MVKDFRDIQYNGQDIQYRNGQNFLGIGYCLPMRSPKPFYLLYFKEVVTHFI